MKRTRVRYAVLGLLVVALAALVAACGGSSETTTTSTTAAPTTSSASTSSSVASSSTSGVLTGDEATIAENWVKFFDGTLPPADKIGLLENGQQYTKEIEAQGASALAKMATAEVSSVSITSPTAAEVKYTILVGGQPALPNQTGEAILQDGVWKVGADSFLALLALQQGALPTSSTSP
ncbi:MAG: hypothetical protein V1912_10505 [bacterium]